jgi:FkbM family methyltransferase
MRDPFFKRKLKQIGKKFQFNLIDSNIPSELFPIIINFRDNNNTCSGNDEHNFLSFVIRHLNESKSQICQDLLTLFITNNKENGYFVEFGATNGITLSNTYLLEKSHQWTGIVAEPAKNWHNQLLRNRNCIIDTRCVWTETGKQLTFHESEVGELSTIDIFSNNDKHATARSPGKNYLVDTISLDDLLSTHNAPNIIDYLSIDTEGSEFDILNKFDFQKHKFNIITVEHNFTESREKINILLKINGYTRIFERFSQWDDWYIRDAYKNSLT